MLKNKIIIDKLYVIVFRNNNIAYTEFTLCNLTYFKNCKSNNTKQAVTLFSICLQNRIVLC